MTYLTLLACFLISLAAAQVAPVQLVVAPSVITSSNNQVAIKWAGVVNATTYDFITLYSPSTASYEQEIGWINTSTVVGYDSGSGVTTVPLLNMRSDYIFRFWKSYDGPLTNETISRKAPYTDPLNTTFVLAGTSNIVTFQNPNEPLQGHLALTPVESEMRIMWVSGDNSSIPTVQYGTDSSNLNMQATGLTSTYAITEMCASPANTTPNWRDPGYIHDAVMTQLSAATKYYYRYGSSSAWSPVFSFFSAPTVGPQSEAYIVAYGDLGVSTPFSIAREQQLPSAATAAFALNTINSPSELSGEVASDIPWLTLHVGDISYARGYAFLWEYFFNLIQPVATQSPYMVCIGNHEYDYLGQPFSPAGYGYGSDSGGECGVPYLKRFHMPTTGQAEEDLWYSFNYGPIHFVLMSTEHNFTVGSPQYNFLANDLASVNRSVTPFVIFSGHRPMYSSMGGGWAPVHDIIEPLVVKYKVNLCLWGHVHNYERTCGMSDYNCADSDDDAPVHVVIGMAGNTYNGAWDGANSKGIGEEVEPDWSIFRSVTYGYTRLYANATHLHLEFLTDQRNEVHDSLWLHANN